MALRLSYWILFFHLLFLMCNHGNGAKDVAKQDWKQVEPIDIDQPDTASHETTPGTKESDYITAYKTTEDAKKSGYVAQGEGGYAASYSTKQDAKDSYITSYGTKEASKNSKMKHKKHCHHANGKKDVIRQHLKQMEVENEKEMNPSYLAGYKNRQAIYITSYGTKKMEVSNEKAMNPSYLAGYKKHWNHANEEEEANQKETNKMEQPYIAGYTRNRQQNYKASYGTREDAKQNYITAYTRQDAKDSYITAYGTNEASKNSGMEHKKHYEVEVINLKEMDQPYIAGYNRNKQVEVIDLKEMDQPYIAGYNRNINQKEMDQPYIAGYNRNKNQKEMEQPYIAGHNRNKNQKEMEQPYIAGYNRNKQANYTASNGTIEDAKDNYTTAYTRQDAKDNYVTAYGTKEASKSFGMEHKKHDGVEDVAYDLKQEEVANQKEMDQPYIAGYHKNKQANYITSYGTRQDAKESYMTQYGSKQDRKESPFQNGALEMANQEQEKVELASQEKSDQPYIAGYRNMQDMKESNYIAAYGAGEDSNETVMIHEDHKATKPLSHMDHLAAFKSGFFTMDDLFVGNIMPIHFPIQEFSQFLPREEADSIPFSIPQLPNLLQLFSIPIDSPNARAMEDTLEQCEAAPIKGETKLCATSLESMLDFVHSIMDSWANLNVLTTTHPTMSNALTQNYAILRVSKEIYAPKWVACHPLPYPYKIFFCHFIERSKIFKVSLGGEDGHNVEAVAVCHLDTSDWDPDHIIFRQLGVKPGSSPICHFLPIYHLVWVPSPTIASI